jgi:2,3-bisphosphoglycerate-independent phosphoglycerate mutase
MHDTNRRLLALIILDGWGISERMERNAIAQAHTPHYDELCRSFPMTTLVSSGERVGLPKGEPGSPEAGHLNLGSGRIMQTGKCMIDSAIETGEFFKNKVLINAMQSARTRGAAVHFAGLLSDAGIHSNAEHLFALLRLAKTQSLDEVYVHCFLDGHDVPVKTADIYVEALEVKMAEIGIGQIASLCGRHYAMDAEGNWERTARSYTMMVHSEGEGVLEPKKAIRDAFVRGYTDEFIRPIIVEKQVGVPVAPVRDGDVVIFFNHRGDSMRQLVNSVAASGESDPKPFTKPQIEIVTLTEYDPVLSVAVAFPPQSSVNTLTETLAKQEYSSFRITESERSSHLESIFRQTSSTKLSRSETLRSLERGLRSSKPEMSSFKMADRFISHLESADGNFCVVNLPAPALLAEAGDFEKTVEAVQFVDTCLGGILEKVRDNNGVAIVTASHAGCERMKNRSNGGQVSRSSDNPVPFHLVDPESNITELRSDGALEDVAPTVLGILGIDKPPEMTGTDLRIFHAVVVR